MAADPPLGTGGAKGEEPTALSLFLFLLLQHVWEGRSCLGVPAASSTSVRGDNFAGHVSSPPAAKHPGNLVRP